MVCAMLVVTIHTPCEPFIQKRLLAINAVAVPLFFLISGYLFAGGTSEPGWYAKKVSSRVKSLLVPYVVWNVMYWLPVYIAAIIANAANVPFGELSYIESRMFAKWDILGRSFLHLSVLSPLWRRSSGPARARSRDAWL